MTDPGPTSDADGLGRTAGWAGPFLRGETAVELTPLRSEKRRLAAAMRAAIAAVVSVDAPIEQVSAVAAELEEIAARFGSSPAAPYEGHAEAATAPSVGGFYDHSPVLGEANPLAPPVRLTFSPDLVVGRAVFGAAYEGPPGCVHGGWIAAAFDEVLGAAQSISGSGGMTAYLKVDYRSPTPLHQEVRFEGELERVEGRKIFTRGRLHHGDVLTAEAEALFVSVDFSRFADMLRRRGSEGGSSD